MINFDIVKQTIIDWCEYVLPNYSFIFYYPNAPRPSTFYHTIDLTSLSQIGEDYTFSPSSATDSPEIVGNREFICNIQGYGGEPFTRLETLRSSLQKLDVEELLEDGGIVYVTTNPIIDLTSIVDTGFESRASLDIIFRIAQVQTQSGGIIQAVEGSGELHNGETITEVEFSAGEPYEP